MSLPIILFIMLVSGIIGGSINSLLSANTDPVTGNKIRSAWNCILIGIGATILVPLFLEIAQSNILAHIHTGWALQDTTKTPSVSKSKTLPQKPKIKDTSKTKDADTNKTIKVDVKATVAMANDNNPLKTYLLFFAYCFLAAAAGPRFINGLIDSVLKDKTIDTLKQKNAEERKQKDVAVAEKEKVTAEKDKVVEEKKDIEKTQELQSIENRELFKKEETVALKTAGFTAGSPASATAKALVTPGKSPRLEIGPITVPDDPQKGRFGGDSESNGRALKATVTKSKIPEFYNVTIWVESTDKDKPLDSDVVFYLHDSFRPAVYTIKPKEFENGKAIDEDLLSYGAFTVGAVTDNGETLLELDLAENGDFPEQFRRR